MIQQLVIPSIQLHNIYSTDDRRKAFVNILILVRCMLCKWSTSPWSPQLITIHSYCSCLSRNPRTVKPITTLKLLFWCRLSICCVVVVWFCCQITWSFPLTAPSHPGQQHLLPVVYFSCSNFPPCDKHMTWTTFSCAALKPIPNSNHIPDALTPKVLQYHLFDPKFTGSVQWPIF